jgi:hypothetical protein
VGVSRVALEVLGVVAGSACFPVSAVLVGSGVSAVCVVSGVVCGFDWRVYSPLGSVLLELLGSVVSSLASGEWAGWAVLACCSGRAGVRVVFLLVPWLGCFC